MPPRAETSSKKPTGTRPKPRRLLSLDALRKGLSGQGHEDEGSGSTSNPFRARQAEKAISEDSEDPFADGAQWTEKELVTSPDVHDPEEYPFKLNTPAPKHVPPALDLSKAGVDSSDSPVSPSKRRWDTIRHHVLPSSSSIISTSTIPSPTLDLSQLDRPSTPRLHKFGQKKQFQQLVNAAQVQQHQDHKKFTDALWRAGWAAHVGDISTRPRCPRPEREPTLGSVGSSLHLPFMASSTSLQMPGGGVIPAFPSAFKASALRRPQSISSVSTTSGAAPSVSYIARVLAAAGSANRPRILPHENLILSALLSPFVTMSEHLQVEVEQATAVETFELIVRTYRPPTIEVRNQCPFKCSILTY